MIIKILLFLALAGMCAVNVVQNRTITKQHSLIRQMVTENPNCMVDPQGLPGHRVDPKAITRPIVPNPEQRGI
jgi:hypothetical protein